MKLSPYHLQSLVDIPAKKSMKIGHATGLTKMPFICSSRVTGLGIFLITEEAHL
jgi:hypothetical protein